MCNRRELKPQVRERKVAVLSSCRPYALCGGINSRRSEEPLFCSELQPYTPNQSHGSGPMTDLLRKKKHKRVFHLFCISFQRHKLIECVCVCVCVCPCSLQDKFMTPSVKTFKGKMCVCVHVGGYKDPSVGEHNHKPPEQLILSLSTLQSHKARERDVYRLGG